MKTKNAVSYHLRQMIEGGMIEIDQGAGPRAIRIPGYEFVKKSKEG